MIDVLKYILIGEKLASKELYSVMDFIARDEEFRFNSFVSFPIFEKSCPREVKNLLTFR